MDEKGRLENNAGTEGQHRVILARIKREMEFRSRSLSALPLRVERVHFRG